MENLITSQLKFSATAEMEDLEAAIISHNQPETDNITVPEVIAETEFEDNGATTSTAPSEDDGRY